MTHCRPSLEEGLDVLSVNDDETHWQYDQGIIYTPTGVLHPLLTLTHTPNCAPPMGVCVLF